MLKIEGLDEFQRELQTAQDAFAELDGELGSVSFDPKDPASIDFAIKNMEKMVDERAGRYAGNSFVGPMSEEMKESFRAEILEKAAAARLRDDK